VPVPLRQTFDFLMPAEIPTPTIGARLRVPFGARKLVGIVVAVKSCSDYPQDKLREALALLDSEPVFDPHLWSTLNWLSGYYLAPIGEVTEGAMPVVLRQGDPIKPPTKRSWRLTELGRSSPIDDLQRAPLQLAIIKRFMRSSVLSSEDFREESSGWRQAVDSLMNKGWLVSYAAEPSLPSKGNQATLNTPPLALNRQQETAVQIIYQAILAKKFASFLLHGVTGSGKTEVYFAAMQKVVELGQQVLLLVPEIGLTPQLIDRIEQRFTEPVVVMHSNLNKTERHLAWWHARVGNAKIIVGTRSAVFTALPKLGLIVVDEEHDGSFKQQDGVRYQARDVAIYRAKQHDIPIVLGSATPSLESYANAKSGRYQKIQLTERATSAKLPDITLLDLRQLPTQDGLSPLMSAAIKTTLEQGRQAMLFLNRRGYAPVLYCSDCGATAKCHRCDSHLTLHKKANRMRCHHCGYEGAAISNCTNCKSAALVDVGEGTQRVEQALAERFPAAKLLRIDRDSTRNKGQLTKLLEQARSGAVDILLGTQLITKGHDFPNVSMVGVLNADQGLYSTDFRASEHLFQQLVQVAGRAGRRDQQGQVLIQTAFPHHPFFDRVVQHDYQGFADELLSLRKSAAYPPFGFFALLRAESTHQSKALQFLRRAKRDIQVPEGVRVMDVIPAPMERRAGKYRAQLLLCSQQRSALNRSLRSWLDKLASDQDLRKLGGSVRWSLDVDPLDHY